MAPLTVLIGRLLKSSSARGLLFNADRVFGAGELRRARGQDQVLQVHRVRDVDGRQPLRVQLVEIQVHHDLAVLAAERDTTPWRLARCASGVRMKLFPRSKISCSLERLAAEAELQNRHARRVVLQDLRRERARRHVAHRDLALRDDLREREIDLHVRMEVDADGRDALVRLRLDMLDADDVDGERALEVR